MQIWTKKSKHFFLPLSFVKISSIFSTGLEYSSTISLTAFSLYILKHPGQHITEPIMFWELLIVQKSKSTIVRVYYEKKQIYQTDVNVEK